MKHWATTRHPPDIAQQGVRAGGVVGILRTWPSDLDVTCAHVHCHNHREDETKREGGNEWPRVLDRPVGGDEMFTEEMSN